MYHQIPNLLVKIVADSCDWCSLSLGMMNMWPFLSWQPHEDISVVSWNRQVQHILSSAHPSGKAVVWDLRKNEPIIKVSDHSNRVSRKKPAFLTSLQHTTCDYKAVAQTLGIRGFILGAVETSSLGAVASKHLFLFFL